MTRNLPRNFQWKHFWNRLRFDTIMVMSLWPTFLAHPVESSGCTNWNKTETKEVFVPVLFHSLNLTARRQNCNNEWLSHTHPCTCRCWGQVRIQWHSRSHICLRRVPNIRCLYDNLDHTPVSLQHALQMFHRCLPTVILTISCYSITHSFFHSRLKTFLCKSFPPPFLFLLQDSLYGFSQTVYWGYFCAYLFSTF